MAESSNRAIASAESLRSVENKTEPDLKKVQVIKFGGTSVKNTARMQHVCEIIQQSLNSGPVLVVVSAMGDTTDYLLRLAKQCAGDPDKRELDLLLSTGEQISISLIAMMLRSMGIKARSFTASQVGIFTEKIFTKARIVDLKTERIMGAFKENDVLIVAGFQGITDDGDVTTLGRGGSDTTAVALAAAMSAESCDIFTDVDGVYTADPHLIRSARLLNQISYEEVLEMARLGAQVIHPRAVELARQYKIKLRIRNTFKLDHGGTCITGGENVEIYRTVSGVAVDKNQASVAIMEVPDEPGIAGKILRSVSERNIVIDMIMQAFHASTGLNNITFTVHESDLAETIEVLTQLKTDIGASAVQADADIAKVSLIGANMVAQPGIAAQAFEVLGKAKINIKMIAASEMKLTCVVARQEADKAALLLHEAFELEKV